MFDYAKAAVLIREYFAAPFIENLRRDATFLALMDERQIKYTEKNKIWKVNYAGNSSVGSYAENDNLGVAGEQAYATAQMDWKLNKGVIRASGLSQAVGKSENSIIDVLTQETESVMKDLKRQMNLQMLSDGQGNLNGPRPDLAKNGPNKDLTGILAAIDDGSIMPNYAGIDRGANLWWRSFVLDNGGVPRPITEALMMQASNEIKIRGGNISHILCSYNVWTQYGLLLKQERRQATQETRLIGGFETLLFNGMPVVAMPDYEEGRMDFLDISQFEYLILQDFAVEPRDPGQFDATQFIVKHYAELVCLDPWRAASIRDIAA